jgi:outer membrane protein assembly factor BamB
MAITAALRTIGWLLGSIVLAAGQPGAVDTETLVRRLGVDAPSALVNRTQAEAAGLTVYWQRSIPLEKGERLSRIERVEENLYLITQKNRVLTLDAATGVLRWSATLAQEGIRLLGPTHGPDQVYFASVLGVDGLDRINGDKRLNWRSPIAPSSPVASDGQELYFGTIDGRVVSIRQRDLLMSWQFGTEGLVTARPVLRGQNLYVVSQMGQVSAARKGNKTRVWQARTTGPVQAGTAVGGSHLYVASMDQSLWCFDLATGRTIWRTRMQYPLPNGPHATAKHVYLPVAEHGLFSIDPDDGKIAWHHEDAMAFLAETEDLVWLASLRSSVLGCDKATGEIRREIALSASLYFSNEEDDAIWMADEDGQVICLRPQGAGFLRYRKAYEAIGRSTPPTTQPTSRPAGEGFVPTPPPKPPVDYLRRNDAIPPVGGSTPATQPADGG